MVVKVPTDQEVARVAYEAYADSTGGVSAVTGAELPDWSGVSAEVRAAWVASVVAVRRRLDRAEAGR
jgi:hypothetical protein